MKKTFLFTILLFTHTLVLPQEWKNIGLQGTLTNGLYSLDILPGANPGSVYFPAAIGNTWIYNTEGSSYPDTITVVDSQAVNGKTYYLFNEGANYQFGWFKEENGKLFIVDTSTAEHLDPANLKEVLLYDFTGNPGDTIDVPLGFFHRCLLGGKTILESKDTSIETPAGTFTGCFRFSREVPCMDAGIINEWYVPGIGKAAYDLMSIMGIQRYNLTYSNLITGINDKTAAPSEFNLSQNYPNPFNAGTTIKYKISKQQTSAIEIYNILGQKIRGLINEELNPGEYSLYWNGTDDYSLPVSSGIYFCVLKSGNYAERIKMILLK